MSEFLISSAHPGKRLYLAPMEQAWVGGGGVGGGNLHFEEIHFLSFL